MRRGRLVSHRCQHAQGEERTQREAPKWQAGLGQHRAQGVSWPAGGGATDLDQCKEDIWRLQLALVDVVHRGATAAVGRLLGRVIGDIEPEGACLAESSANVRNVQPGGAPVMIGEQQLEERGHEGVRVDEEEEGTLEVRWHVGEVHELVLLSKHIAVNGREGRGGRGVDVEMYGNGLRAWWWWWGGSIKAGPDKRRWPRAMRALLAGALCAGSNAIVHSTTGAHTPCQTTRRRR